MWRCAVLIAITKFVRPLMIYHHFSLSIVCGSLYYVYLALLLFQVLDEADRMLDMGFEPQIREIVSRIRVSVRSVRILFVK